jgi:hypothetical protein
MSIDLPSVKSGTEIDNHGRLEVGAKVMIDRPGKTGTIKEISHQKRILIQWDGGCHNQTESYYPFHLLGEHKFILVIPAFRLGDIVTCDNERWIVDVIASEVLYLQSTESSIRIARTKWQCEKIACAIPLSWPDETLKPYNRGYSSEKLTLELYYDFKFWLDTTYPHANLVTIANNERSIFKAWEDSQEEILKITRWCEDGAAPWWPETDIRAAWDRAFKHRIQELKEREGCRGVRLGDRITQDVITGTVVDIDELTGDPIIETGNFDN